MAEVREKYPDVSEELTKADVEFIKKIRQRDEAIGLLGRWAWTLFYYFIGGLVSVSLGLLALSQSFRQWLLS